MLPETKQETVIEETETEATDTQPTKKEKVFTQAEVNAIIAKEKEAVKRTFGREKEALSAVETNLRSDVEFYEAKFADVIKAQTADFDPITADLFNSLPLRERLEKLANPDFMGKVRRKNTIPETPKESGDSVKAVFTRKSSV
jgi:hypothetical protein